MATQADPLWQSPRANRILDIYEKLGEKHVVYGIDRLTMTQEQRATAVLNYLEEQDSKTVINILNPMLDDEALELVYFGLVRDGIFEEESDDEE